MDNPNFEPAIVASEANENEIHENPLPFPSETPISRAPVTISTDAHPEIKLVLPIATDASPAPDAEPVSSLMKKIFQDPATLKLISVMVSVIALCTVSPDVRSDHQAIASFGINGISLIYSMFAIYVTVFSKSQEQLAKNGFLKKVFAGRNVHWHELHSTMTLSLALANLSCVTFYMYDPLGNVIVSLINAVAFGSEFFLVHKTSKSFVVEESAPKCNCKLSKCVLGLFRRHPIKFNIFQLASLITAFVLYLCEAYWIRSYFFYSSVVAIIGSSLPLFFRFAKRRGCRCGAWYFSNPKIQTYLSIGITLHAFFAVLTNSFDLQRVSWYYSGTRATIMTISFVFSCVVFGLSLLDLYSQAIFHKSRPINETQNPLIVKSDRPFRNLPTILENPLGIEGVKEVYTY